MSEDLKLDIPVDFERLWVDDCRDPVIFIGADPLEDLNKIVWKKTFDAALEALRINESKITHIDFDNDLGEKEKGKEGRDLFIIVENLLSEGKLKKLKRIRFHSDDTTGIVLEKVRPEKDFLKEKYGIELSGINFKIKSITPCPVHGSKKPIIDIEKQPRF